MANAISNTSPLVYLHRINALNWLPHLFDTICTPPAVVLELEEGIRRGYDLPHPNSFPWLQIVPPQTVPAEWFALDLGKGEIAAMSLSLENPDYVVILDDALARHVAQAAGLSVWGTLRVLLGGKKMGLAPQIEPMVNDLESSGMWISADIRRRILSLAGEAGS